MFHFARDDEIIFQHFAQLTSRLFPYFVNYSFVDKFEKHNWN